MIITDEPMPNVQQPGDANICLVAVCGMDIKVLKFFDHKEFEVAKTMALSMAAEYREVVLLDATILYRAWQKENMKAK